eukprot:scaffold478_cov409-Prasinococcus_capsulatus_cf.AAC.23
MAQTRLGESVVHIPTVSQPVQSCGTPSHGRRIAAGDSATRPQAVMVRSACLLQTSVTDIHVRNLALHKPVRQSSTQMDCHAQNVVDGETLAVMESCPGVSKTQVRNHDLSESRMQPGRVTTP